jgi:hypothetical protein
MTGPASYYVFSNLYLFDPHAQCGFLPHSVARRSKPVGPTHFLVSDYQQATATLSIAQSVMLDEQRLTKVEPDIFNEWCDFLA